MQLKISKAFWQVLGLGVLAGMRSASAPAVAGQLLSRHPSKTLADSPLKFMQSGLIANILTISAVGELVVDKLPGTGNRTMPMGVAARCLSGALAGAGIYKSANKNLLTGALIGGAAAVGSTFGSFLLRRSVVKASRLADPWVGAIEDALVIGTGAAIIRLA